MPNISHELLINSSSEIVYKAVTSAHGLSSWWTPDSRLEQGANGIIHLPFGGNYFKEMKIVHLRPNNYVEWLCIQGAEEWKGTSIYFTLQQLNDKDIPSAFPEITGQLEQQISFKDGTLLTFRHCNWERESRMYSECNYTWALFLRSLKLFCETGIGQPWPTQHR